MARPRGEFQEIRPQGEKYLEYIGFVMLAIVLFAAGRWYFKVYRHSPSVTLVNYVGALKAGNAEAQYDLLDEKTKSYYPDISTYTSKWPMSKEMAGKMGDFTVSNMLEIGDNAEADVTLSVRQTSSSLVSIAADSFTDHYTLTKDKNDGKWKIALADCYQKIKSRSAVEQR